MGRAQRVARRTCVPLNTAQCAAQNVCKCALAWRWCRPDTIFEEQPPVLLFNCQYHHVFVSRLIPPSHFPTVTRTCTQQDIKRRKDFNFLLFFLLKGTQGYCVPRAQLKSISPSLQFTCTLTYTRFWRVVPTLTPFQIGVRHLKGILLTGLC